MTDEQLTPTVRDRLIAAGWSESRIAEHVEAGRVRVDGVLVEDLDMPAPAEAQVVVQGHPVRNRELRPDSLSDRRSRWGRRSRRCGRQDAAR